MIEPNDYDDCIATPTLAIMGQFDQRMNTPEALALMMGTVAQESDMGRYLKQKGDGPAIGAPQVEPATHQSLWGHYLSRPSKRKLALLIADLAPGWTVKWDDTGDGSRSVHSVHNDALHEPRYCFAIARLKYWPKTRPIPALDDHVGRADYWDVFYNANGKPQIGEFLHSWDTWLKRWRGYAPTQL